MPNNRLAGVYFEDNPKIERGVSLGETGVPAFIGVANRGPLNEPVVIESVQQFLRFFGEPVKGSYLYASVWGFFMNGGTRCQVIRVAHVFRNGQAELARRARYELLDKAGYPTLEILASSEGSWGNLISIQISYPEEPRVHTFITLDLAEGSHMLTVQSTRGIERGMMLKISDNVQERYVTVERIRGNEVYWRDPLDIGFRSASPTYIDSVDFNMTVKYRKVVEKFSNLSLGRWSARNISRVVAQESEHIRVNILSTGEYENYPDATDELSLRGGRDGLDGITPEDIIGYNNGPGARYGLGALESNEEIDLVCIPDLQYCLDHCPAFQGMHDMLGVQLAMINHCERQGDRFAILDMPRDLKVEQAHDYRSKFESSFGAIYYPWLLIRDEKTNEPAAVPSCGFMAGLYAKCDHTEGVFRAPANIPIEGIIGLHTNMTEGQLTELNNKGVNCFRTSSQRGIRPWGVRALTNSPEWRYLMSRRVFNAVRRAIYENTQWVVFEVNNPDLQHRVRDMLVEFLGKLWAAGYFPGKVQDDAFFVTCDKTNNEDEDNDMGVLKIDVGIALGKPMEYLVISFEHKLEEQGVGV
ncbi:MAG: phage tail sheath family protein [Proteobacteria bacterium]|nr:phage tail sheath family protein [Pseudomonadota bacterium]